jgi:hypothetical protein
MIAAVVEKRPMHLATARKMRPGCPRRHGYAQRLLALGAVLSLLIASSLVRAASESEPPRFSVPAPKEGGPLTFVVYGDTRFTARTDVANVPARRALVPRIAGEHPAAIFIGGDLVYQGSDAADYDVYKSETAVWLQQAIPVFPALGNHEFRGCVEESVCLDNWWKTFASLSGTRWYSVTVGTDLLVLVLDSNAALRRGSQQRVWLEQQIVGADPQIQFIMIVLHYPPVRDPFYPSARDEKEVARYLSRKHKAGSLHAQIVVVGSHVHNYERYRMDGVTYLVSGGGGANPHPALRMFGELSHLKTGVNFHYIRFVLQNGRLEGTMVRFDAKDGSHDPWSEPDRFEVSARPAGGAAEQ